MRGPLRTAEAVEDFPRPLVDQVTDSERAAVRRFAAGAVRGRGGIHLAPRLVQHGSHPPAERVHGTSMGPLVRVPPRAHGIEETERAARPAGGGSQGALPEARPLEVPVRTLDTGPSADPQRADVDAGRSGMRERARRPLGGAGDRRVAQTNLDQPPGFALPRGHEGGVQERRSAAEPLGPFQPPAVRRPHELQPSIRLGSPHAVEPAVAGLAARLPEDGHRVEVALGEACQRQVRAAPGHQPVEAGRGRSGPPGGEIEVALARHRAQLRDQLVQRGCSEG